MKSSCAKKILLGCLFLALAISLSVADEEFSAGLQQAHAGDFTGALKEFQISTAAQPATGSLLNLGLAAWRDGKLGLALWSWEQTVWQNPGDQAARQNLRYAFETAQLDAPELAWHERLSTWLSPRIWAVILCVSLWSTVGMMVLPGVLGARKAGWHQTFAAFSLGIFLLSIAPNLGVLSRGRIGFVLERNTPLRLTPTKEAESIVSMNTGESVRRIRDRGDFVLIQTAHGAGWVKRDQLAFMGRPLN